MIFIIGGKYMSDFSIDNLVSSLSRFWPIATEVSRNLYKIASDQIDPIIKQYELEEDGFFFFAPSESILS
jgi:hypothetical protein